MPAALDEHEFVKAALLELRSTASSLLSAGLARHGLSGGVLVPQLVELARSAAMTLSERLKELPSMDSSKPAIDRHFKTGH